MSTQMTESRSSVINGIDTEALSGLVEEIRADPSRGIARFEVRTEWKGGARTDTHVEGWSLGGERKPKDFTIRIDEPEELLGTNQFANPQEYLFAAINACMMATFVAACSVNGIALESVVFETHGELDLRGFLAIDRRVPAGYEAVRYTIRVKGDGTKEQFDQVHEFMRQTSPNFYNLNRAIAIEPVLVVE